MDSLCAVEAEEVAEPERAHGEDGKEGERGGEERGGEDGNPPPEGADGGTGEGGGERVGEEVARGRTEELSDAAGPLGREDGEAGCALEQVKGERGEASGRTEQHADEDNGEGLQGGGDGGEGHGKGDVGTDRDEERSGDREEQATCAGLPKRLYPRE